MAGMRPNSKHRLAGRITRQTASQRIVHNRFERAALLACLLSQTLGEIVFNRQSRPHIDIMMPHFFDVKMPPGSAIHTMAAFTRALQSG